jgi:four helix bundle protein
MVFGLAVLRLIDKLPMTASGQTVGRQLATSATSVGANYRSACIARSRSEFIAKLGVVVEEADEAMYWIELTRRGRLLAARDVAAVLNEAIELRAIFGKSLGTARANARQIARFNTR